MEVTRTIRYRGSAARAGALVQALEREGAHVEWTPPREERGLGADATAVVLAIVASGGYDAIKAAVARMRAWMPRAEIVIEEGQPGEDAEPVPQPGAPPRPGNGPMTIAAATIAIAAVTAPGGSGARGGARSSAPAYPSWTARYFPGHLHGYAVATLAGCLERSAGWRDGIRGFRAITASR